jgi:anti-anti-sigma factor
MMMPEFHHWEVPPRVGSAMVQAEVLRLTGDLEWWDVEMLRAALREVARRCPSEFGIDLTEVDFLDSAAVAVLFEFCERRPLIRVRGDSIVHRMLTITGVDELGLLDIDS